ncbi:hydroxymethylbilane synthase [Francisella philomiragia]|uniref:Porphobilinogen deaminase n=1 Tax=Francisella philomiragia subsp. philomiragia (strain ATCC 25017 / CCUG 19701 / FSC 153 / O\|nr:hydroxymethylbilane synthase [Francisella philomiragia]B0TW04.1 RecName: Full=Porphobilinogen deaminase; Short=PBG; AltName: Full=Hydroxymethylbilane synthase; Short=HMBS; AltName: Full=Pre-uroporphyrinogen synthase [Francisella philomiragia subsp. philomiragia ATCC 25017]AJI46619.1 porphobilinogen deaminase [Francisella philomiragia]AJI48407.1 hydroxymethylbilane synthase [Francisella philomiragia]MBK2020184.1 hydroxymethylbilane synthase [Francisella philomiragia]MBK2030630.1 hydroxymethy
MKQIVIASRESKLALWQTNYVKDRIQQELNIRCQINTMKTQGDIILDKPLNKIGGKALFMKELEIAMLNNKADIAVHSLKDVPYQLPQGFCLSSFMPREDPRDAFVSNKYSSIDDLPRGAIVGTSSLRRKAQLLHYRYDLEIRDLRGNVQTRLSKLDNGDYDAIILASAGLIRLELNERITQFIPVEISLPAVGQGIVVIEALDKSSEILQKLQKLNCSDSFCVATAERAFNQELKGGCHVAIGAYAELHDNQITLTAMVASSDGKNILKRKLTGDDPMRLGKLLAQEMIELGAYKILEK